MTLDSAICVRSDVDTNTLNPVTGTIMRGRLAPRDHLVVLPVPFLIELIFLSLQQIALQERLLVSSQ